MSWITSPVAQHQIGSRWRMLACPGTCARIAIGFSLEGGRSGRMHEHQLRPHADTNSGRAKVRTLNQMITRYHLDERFVGPLVECFAPLKFGSSQRGTPEIHSISCIRPVKAPRMRSLRSCRPRLPYPISTSDIAGARGYPDYRELSESAHGVGAIDVR